MNQAKISYCIDENDQEVQPHNKDLEEEPSIRVQTPAPTEEEIRAQKDYELGMSKLNNSKTRDLKLGYNLLMKAADAGNIQAKEEIAFDYYFGNYLNRNLTTARVVFEELSVKGSAKGQFGLGLLQTSGLSIKSNQAKALVYFTFGALGGDPTAQMSLGYRYWSGIGVENQCEFALSYYKKVASYVASKISPNSAGNTIHRIRLYDEEENAKSENPSLLDDDLVQYYQLLADRGDVQAQYGLGLLHYQGGRGEMQPDRALYYFSRAAEAGNYYAMAYMGKLYAEGSDSIKQDNLTAYKYFKQAAEKGNPIGQAGLGTMYFYGAGVERDYSKALKYFTFSADQGYVEGHFLMGVMYYYGYGIKKDYKQAVKYFNLAAQSGHVLAYFNLAQMHSSGIGVIRSCQTATELYKTVAERGPWASLFMEAHQSYKEGDLDTALLKYIYLAELGYEVAQSNVAYILDQHSTQTSLFNKQEAYKRALVYWNRAALQGYHLARLKLGDYYYYGLGTSVDYQQAASHYKYATDIAHNPQAMFNLAYMHEQGLGLKRDIHLAKRFYDLAFETAAEAYLPVSLALFKLNFLFAWESYKSLFGNTDRFQFTGSYWDLYLMSAIAILIFVLYKFQRR